jgi:hypothetical protein
VRLNELDHLLEAPGFRRNSTIEGDVMARKPLSCFRIARARARDGGRAAVAAGSGGLHGGRGGGMHAIGGGTRPALYNQNVSELYRPVRNASRAAIDHHVALSRTGSIIEVAFRPFVTVCGGLGPCFEDGVRSEVAR